LRGERVISPRTVRYVHAILHRALKEAVSLGIVSRNITDAVAPPKAPVRPSRAGTWPTRGASSPWPRATITIRSG